MAERRMFAKSIIDSDAFLSMPLSAQALYFHLNMRADDDGFVSNPRKIQRMICCADDDLKLLIAKRYILVFESGVIVIKHWKIHNLIRNDRYKPTLYEEEKSALFQKKDGAYTDHELVEKKLGMTVGKPNGNQMEPQVRLGKDRLGKVSEDNTSVSPTAETLFDQVRNSFIQNCPSLPKPNSVAHWTPARKKAIRDKKLTAEEFTEVFKKIEQSDFLTGRKGDWHCSFDWILKPANWQKINEGNYDNRGPDHKIHSKSSTFSIDEYEQSTSLGQDIEALEKSGVFDDFDRK